MKIQLFLFYPQGAEVSRMKSKTRKSLDFECSFQNLVRTCRAGGGKKKGVAAPVTDDFLSAAGALSVRTSGMVVATIAAEAVSSHKTLTCVSPILSLY